MTIVDRTRSTPSATTRASAPARAAHAVHEHARRCGEARSRVRSMARGRPGRAPPVRAGGRRPPRAWRGHPAGAGGLRDVGPPQRAGRQRDPRRARPDRGQPCRRPAGEATRRRAGGTALIGPGRPLDTDRWFVVASNVLGGCQGTTGPSSLAADGRRWGSRFPFVTVRDQVTVEAAPGGRDRGAAMGGGPRRVDGRHARPRVGRHRTPTRSTAPWCSPARRTPRPTRSPGRSRSCWRSGPTRTSAAATTTTSTTGSPGPSRHGHRPADRARDLPERDRARRPVRARAAGAGAAARRRRPLRGESYLDHHAAKLSRRFDANSYLVAHRGDELTHDVGRDRGGVAAALADRHGADHRGRRRLRPALPRAAQRRDRRRRAGRDPAHHRVRTTGTTGSSSRSSRSGRTSATRCADRRLVGALVRGWSAPSRASHPARRGLGSGRFTAEGTRAALSHVEEVRRMSIVVGYIPTREGRAALRRAADEAELRKADSSSSTATAARTSTRMTPSASRPRWRASAPAVQAGINVEVRQLVRGKEPAEDLIEAAESSHAELIVIGLRRRTPVGKLILGSNAQRILLDATCPVLAVKATSRGRLTRRAPPAQEYRRTADPHLSGPDSTPRRGRMAPRASQGFIMVETRTRKTRRRALPARLSRPAKRPEE